MGKGVPLASSMFEPTDQSCSTGTQIAGTGNSSTRVSRVLARCANTQVKVNSSLADAARPHLRADEPGVRAQSA